MRQCQHEKREARASQGDRVLAQLSEILDPGK